MWLLGFKIDIERGDRKEERTTLKVFDQKHDVNKWFIDFVGTINQGKIKVAVEVEVTCQEEEEVDLDHSTQARCRRDQWDQW